MEIHALYEEDCFELWQNSEGGGWIIRCTKGGYFNTYEVPLYGGEERAMGKHSNIFDALNEVMSWT